MTEAATPRSAAPPPELREVADQVYAYWQPDGSWCLSNAGILVGRDAVTLVDTTATEPRARGLREAVARITPLPPRIVVNTHHHGDHTYGNGVFAPEATIVGHHLTRERMLAEGLLLPLIWPHVAWGEIEVTPPTVTFADRLTLYPGEGPVELVHVGPAHTRDDVVVWLPDRRVLFAGDVVFAGGTPFVMAGSLAGSLDAIARLRALEPDVVVPGHGPVGGTEILDTTEAYLRLVQRIARDAIAAGLTALDAARQADLGGFADLLDPERIVGNLHRAYAEEGGEPRGAELDESTIMLEVVAYNGGCVPTCLA